jgi:beta-galactosidase
MPDMGKILADLTGMTPEQLAAKGQAPAGEGAGSEELNGMMNMMVGPLADAMAVHPILSARLAEAAAALDVAGYNYLTGRHRQDRDLCPNRMVLGSETFPPEIPRLWEIVKANPHVIGDMTWTGYDYLGEAGIGIFRYGGQTAFTAAFPDRAAYVGDIDLIGNRRPVSYLREIVFGLRKTPYISVERMDRQGQPAKTAWMYKDALPSWTWPGFEGKPAALDVFSDAEEVELFLNGQPCGKMPAGPQQGCAAHFTVPYAPGELTARAVRGGVAGEAFTLKTAGPEVRLHLAADRETLQAGGQDLAYLAITLTDGNGLWNMNAQKTVTITVEGAGTLLGLGSADPQAAGSYQDPTWPTYDGALLAVVRSAKEAGEIRVTASAPGCADVTAVLVCGPGKEA